jgi:hypothetical protein
VSKHTSNQEIRQSLQAKEQLNSQNKTLQGATTKLRGFSGKNAQKSKMKRGIHIYWEVIFWN